MRRQDATNKTIITGMSNFKRQFLLIFVIFVHYIALEKEISERNPIHRHIVILWKRHRKLLLRYGNTFFHDIYC